MLSLVKKMRFRLDSYSSGKDFKLGKICDLLKEASFSEVEAEGSYAQGVR